MQTGFEQIDMVVVCGNYNSGKSSLARSFFHDYHRVNKKDIRRFLYNMTHHGDRWNPTKYDRGAEMLVAYIEKSIIRYYLEKGDRVVIDNTSLTRKARARYLEIAKNLSKKIGCVYVEAPVNVLIERNRQRPKKEQVPEKIIADLFSRQEVPAKDEGFDALKISHSAK